MLVFGEDAVTFHMLHNMLSNNGFHSLACNAGDANRFIVAGQASRSFLCIGFILVCFHDSGRQPSSSDFRNIRSRGTSRMSYSSLNTHGCLFSGSSALFGGHLLQS